MKYTKMIKLAKSPAGGDFIVQKPVIFSNAMYSRPANKENNYNACFMKITWTWDCLDKVTHAFLFKKYE